VRFERRAASNELRFPNGLFTGVINMYTLVYFSPGHSVVVIECSKCQQIADGWKADSGQRHKLIPVLLSILM